MTPSDRKLLIGVSIFIVVMTVGGYLVGQYWMDIQIRYYVWKLDSNDEAARDRAYEWLCDRAMANLLDKRLAGIYCRKSFPDTPLTFAIRDIHIGSDGRRVSSFGPLTDDRLNIVEGLLQDGIEANKQTQRGDSPIHIATKLIRKDVITLLLRHNARVNALDRYGRTALDLILERQSICMSSDNSELEGFLRQHGALTSKELKEKERLKQEGAEK